MTSARPRVLVLNGGSSSGKSTLARCLQDVLDGYWLRLGVDTLVAAAPPRLLSPGGGLVLADDGIVTPGPDFERVEDQWMRGVAAVAMAGGRVIVEDNFVSGPTAQQRWRTALGPIATGWIGVRLSADLAAERERSRSDRIPGMAAGQAESVHHGVHYDLEVDTATASAAALAALVRAHFFEDRGTGPAG